MANYKAQFNTALGQRELVFDAKVSADMVVGQVCKYTASTNTFAPTTVEPVAGDYIIAQSDTTMEYGNVPVENRDYRYNPKVKASTSNKKVAVFKITDILDIYHTTI